MTTWHPLEPPTSDVDPWAERLEALTFDFSRVEYVWCCTDCGTRMDHHLASPGADEPWDGVSACCDAEVVPTPFVPVVRREVTPA